MSSIISFTFDNTPEAMEFPLVSFILVYLIQVTYSSHYDSLCHTNKYQIIECRCDQENKEFTIEMDETIKLEEAVAMKISDCENVDILPTTFEYAKDMKKLVLQTIGSMEFNSPLPATLQNIQIQDVQYIKEIDYTVLNTQPQLKELRILNSTVGKIDMNIFTDVKIEQVDFENVIFLNVSDKKHLEKAGNVRTVKFNRCHFKSSIPPFALQFNASEQYEITRNIFSEVLESDAIVARSSKIIILENKFDCLKENAISLHHFSNDQSLKVHFQNNTIYSMDKDAVIFQQTLKYDMSYIQGNIIPCTTAPQCDEKVAWLLTGIKQVREQVPSDYAICNILKTNQCREVQDNNTIPFLSSIALENCHPVKDVIFEENILDICKHDIDKIKENECKSHSNEATIITWNNYVFLIQILSLLINLH